LEIQNGVLAGFVYSYATDGKPEWNMVSGSLVRSEKQGVLWELDTTLTHVDGGSCIGCEFHPGEISEGAAIRLEFMQRNYLRISIGGVFDQYMVPLTYGSAGKAYFSAQTPYIFPEFGPGKTGAQFILSQRPVGTAEDFHWVAKHVYISQVEVTGTQENRKLNYTMWVLDPNGPQTTPTPEDIVGNIICELDASSQQPGCRVELNGIVYHMPIANLGDSRFFAEADDGSIVEAYRINYD